VDGKGSWVRATIALGEREEVVARPDGDPVLVPPPRVRPHLFLGCPQAAAVDAVVEHAVELGAWSIVLAVADRSPSHGRALARRMNRWRSLVVSAAKQSGNPYFSHIELCTSVQEALPYLPSRGWIMRQDAPPPKPCPEETGAGSFSPVSGDLAVAVGPEGDFTREEAIALEGHGLVPACFALHTLRSETACLSGLSFLALLGIRVRHRLGGLGGP